MENQSIYAVKVPLVNPNEPVALLASLHVSNGQKISKGDVLCTLETTKSVLDMVAERAGYIVGLTVNAGENVGAGNDLCFIAPSPDVKPETLVKPPKQPTSDAIEGLPSGLRITHPALNLAKENQLDLTQFPIGPLVTEAVVQAAIVEAILVKTKDMVVPSDPHAVIIYGSGGHGKTLVDLIRQTDNYRIAGFIDDNRHKGETVMEIPVLGGVEVLPELASQGIRQAVNAVGGIGNIQSRIQVFERLSLAGFTFPILVHPTAFVEPSARLSPGVQIFAHAYVGSEAKIGMGVIVNTGAVVSHDCQIADYANISPGAMLAGEVTVGEATLIGMGATINLQVKIGNGVRIGNGATLKSNVPDSGIVRAGTVWPEK
ncbi:MAG: NeuD/PglB/VioB family sugar acetyltransferase [Anaerolineales bacterium]|nr:NeuD/PglB/VioB family sugar acetyltransferase [Anaerolineales bacterium]